MDHDKFEYLPKVVRTRKPGQTASPTPPEQLQQLQRVPVRVSPAGVGWLVYAIVGTIEFHSPVGPRPRRLPTSSSSPSAGAVAGMISPQKVLGAVSSLLSLWSAPRTHMDPSSFAGGGDTERMSFGSPTTTAAAAAAAAAATAKSPTGPNAARRQEEEEAALRRVHEQPVVIPEVEAIPIFGDLCICVCQAHNRTIDDAYRQVLREIEDIVQRHQERAAERTSAATSVNHPLGYPSHQLPPRPSSSSTDRSAGSFMGAESLSALAGAGVGSGGAAAPALPLGSRRSLGTAGSGVFALPSSPLLAHPAGPRPAPPYALLPGEVGLELAVRLLSREAQWHDRRERMLAEFTFPVIRTADESTVIDLHAAFETMSPAESVAGYASPASSLLFVNDPTQIQDILNFISDAFYKTLVLDTFADFFTGELVFDLRVTERRSFAPPLLL